MRVRLIPMGAISNTHLHNLAGTLSARQEVYDFAVSPEAIPVDLSAEVDGVYNEDRLEASILAFASSRLADEYPVAVCDLPLREELSTSFDERSALISIYHWNDQYPGHPLASLLAFNLVDILLTRTVDIPAHDDTRGCPSDFCDVRSDRLIGLGRCEFCSECKAVIARAMRSGRVSLREVASLQRILDGVAGRKRAFVLMHFGGQSDELYWGSIKPALQALGWECQRADEIHKAKEILDVIWEGIHTADLIVADLTDKNPNVFYEVGYAQALPRPTVLLLKGMEDIPFDLRSHQVLTYSASDIHTGRLADSLRQYVMEM